MGCDGSRLKSCMGRSAGSGARLRTKDREEE